MIKTFLRVLPFVVAASAMPVAIAADTPQRLYAKSWEGRTVVLKQNLYTLVFNERGKLGNIKNGRRDGLVVVTSSRGMYLQFDGRQGKDDIVVKDVQQMVEAVRRGYEADSLDLRAYRKIEPVVVHRYSVGAELIVSRVRIERDFVRISLVQPPAADFEDDAATFFTIKWPVPLNKTFSERDLIDELIRLFIEVKPTT